MSEGYRAERHAGAWRVVNSADGTVAGEYGAGAAGAQAAADAVAILERKAAPTSELRAWRKAHRLSQGKLGELLGVTWVTVQRWETGVYKPPPFLHRALRDVERELEQHALAS